MHLFEHGSRITIRRPVTMATVASGNLAAQKTSCTAAIEGVATDTAANSANGAHFLLPGGENIAFRVDIQFTVPGSGPRHSDAYCVACLLPLVISSRDHQWQILRADRQIQWLPPKPHSSLPRSRPHRLAKPQLLQMSESLFQSGLIELSWIISRAMDRAGRTVSTTLCGPWSRSGSPPRTTVRTTSPEHRRAAGRSWRRAKLNMFCWPCLRDNLESSR